MNEPTPPSSNGFYLWTVPGGHTTDRSTLTWFRML